MPGNFFEKMIEVLEKKKNFVRSMNDQSLLMRNDKNRKVIVCLKIDDTLCVEDKKALDTFKKDFVTKEKEKVEDYVGCMIKRIICGILLHQSDII